MIKDYSLYYSYKNIGDVLLIVINNDEKTTKVENYNNVFLLFNNKDELIGINIFNISKLMKIKGEGQIYLPNKILIDVINNVLLKITGISLEYKNDSGYVIGEVVENTNATIKVSTNEQIYEFINDHYSVSNNDKVVILKPNYYLNNGKKIQKNGHLCTEKDLSISDNDKLFTCYDKIEIGTDFFKLRS